jgi:ligand-binding sensor domain-containing protein/two-component sensor histidine kinase
MFRKFTLKSHCLKFRQVGVPIFLLVLVVVFNNSNIAERLPIKTYTVADGLLRDAVYKIKQDSRGFLWFCTDEGVSRFDGYDFVNFTTDDGLPDRNVNDFLETKNGQIYLATDKGLARLNPHGLRGLPDNPMFSVFLPDNQLAEKIETLYEDKKHQVWAGTEQGLYKLDETDGRITFENVPLGEPIGSGHNEPSPKALNVKAILEDRHGTLWIGTFGSGLFRISADGSIRRFTADNSGILDNKITDLLEDRNGQLWMTKRSDELGGVCLIDTQAMENPVRKCYTKKDGLSSNWVRSMLITKDGQLWLATNSGLCKWQGEGNSPVCKTYSAKNDLCDDVFAVTEDRDGNLWTASPCGAKKNARSGFTSYYESDGLDYKQINSIFENSSNELFVSTYRAWRGVSRFDGIQFSLVKPRLPDYIDYVGSGWEQTIWQDKSGAWWIPTGYGLFRSPENTSFENLANATLKKIETGAKGNEVLRLFEDSRGDIWMLTDGIAHDLMRWERAKNIWHDYTSQVGFSGFRFGTCLAEDASGNVWIGASSDDGNGALIRYRDGESRVLTQAQGAPSGRIGDLFTDSRGWLWIATTDEGLWRLDEPNSDRFEFIKYTPANGLSSIAAASVTEDEFGRIYVGTLRGLDRLNPATGQVENFTTADGLPTSFIEIAYRDRKNNLWFGTGNGLAQFTPERQRQRQPPNILIMALRVNGESQGISVLGEKEISQLGLNSDQKQISVDFLGLGASLGEKMKYEYRLNNAADWIPTTDRTVNFANLNSGEYIFEVRTITADRLYSQSASAAFRIDAPIYQRWWFIALTLLLTTLAIYLFYKNRLKRLLEMERMRTLIATDLHDDIGANLTRISLLSEIAKQKSDSGNGNLLSSIANIARESVASMNDIVWAIAPEHDSLLDLTRRMRQHAEEVFALREIDLDFNAPPSVNDLKLSVGVRRDVLLIFKEAVNNAARHSDCTKVEIEFRGANAVLLLKIKDNGQGFATSSESDGQGLRSMTRRAKALGGKLKIDSSPGKGTTVKFELFVTKVIQL